MLDLSVARTCLSDHKEWRKQYPVGRYPEASSTHTGGGETIKGAAKREKSLRK